MDLNPGIRRTVALLNAAGFKTCDSGDGETHDFECDRSYPYVVVLSTRDRLLDDADAIAKLLEAQGIEIGPIGPEGDPGAWIQASYIVASGSASIDIGNVHDRMLPPEA